MQALIAVLKSNLKKTKIGPEKIDGGEFVIEETSTKRDIDLKKDWDVRFLPGQRVEMSMVFQGPGHPNNTCPSCRTSCSGSGDEDINCQMCGTNLRRVTEVFPDVDLATDGTGDSSRLVPLHPLQDAHPQQSFHASANA